jgi:hypothetical protein
LQQAQLDYKKEERIMKSKVIALLITLFLCMPLSAMAGLMSGPGAETTFESWVTNYGGTKHDFEALAPSTYLRDGTDFDSVFYPTLKLSGVVFRSIVDPYGVSINNPVIVYINGGGKEIIGVPLGPGSGGDGRVIYQMVFDSPQLYAGLVRDWGISKTITQFYDSSDNLLAQFGPGEGPTSGKYFIGYLADDPSHLIKKIVCDGIKDPYQYYPYFTRQVGYVDDLCFGTTVPVPGAVWLLGSGLLGLVGLRRFRKS